MPIYSFPNKPTTSVNGARLCRTQLWKPTRFVGVLPPENAMKLCQSRVLLMRVVLAPGQDGRLWDESQLRVGVS